MNCPGPEVLNDFVRGVLDKRRAPSVREHVLACGSCQSLVDKLRHDEELLDALKSDAKASATMTGCAEGASSPRARAAAHMPRIDGYRILGVLGQGGMGIVYRAIQTKLNRHVALKVLPAMVGSANPASVQRFRNEATAAARLHHTNIIPIYDFGESHDAYYYAMELVEGKPLDEVIGSLSQYQAAQASPIRLVELLRISTLDEPGSKGGDDREKSSRTDRGSTGGSGSNLVATTTGKGRVYFRQVAHWMADTADALHYAHDQGVVHRDIKPSNLILSVDGRLMIADFGLAKSSEERSMTMTGRLLGTLRYMSPEQAMAKRVRVDHRTDIYSLGATLYELLTFRPAFPGDDDKQVLGDIIAREPTSPRKIVPHVPYELETICLKMLEKLPDARYPTARAVAEDLRRFINDLPIEAKRPGPVKRVIKFARRWKATTVAVVLSAALLLTAGIGWQFRRSSIAERVRGMIQEAARLEQTGHPEAAVEKYREALAFAPADHRPPINLARMLLEQFDRQPLNAKDEGILTKAMKLSERSLQLQPHRAGSWNSYGMLQYTQGDWAGAELSLRRAVQEDGNYCWAYSNLAKVMVLDGRIDDAWTYIRAAIRIAEETSPEHGVAGIWRTLAAMELHDGNPAALASIERALEESQNDDGAAWALRARLHLTLPEHVDPVQSRKDAEQAETRTDPPDPRIHEVLALAYLRNDDLDEAVEQANRSLELGGMPVAAHLIVALARAKQGRVEEAQAALNAAQESWPAELVQPGDFIVTCHREILWFHEANEFHELRDEVRTLLGDHP